MSQNPFHSQDSLFRFDASGNLVVNFNEGETVQSQVQDDTTGVTTNDTTDVDTTVIEVVSAFDLQSWLLKCNKITCCTTRCINQVLLDNLLHFK
jgi:hypothetical protein